MHKILQSLGLEIHSPQVLRTLIFGIRNFVNVASCQMTPDLIS